MVYDVIVPFLEDARTGKGCSRMSDGAAKEYVMAVMLESQGEKALTMEQLREENVFAVEVIMKRIEAYGLPISFTPEGLIGAYALSENIPGRVVVLLIDCLTKFEGQTVTASMLADLYPFGFYSEETFTRYVDKYLKDKDMRPRVRWACIY
jgi:hypothetical protein